MKQVTYWVLALTTLTLSACGSDPGQNVEPSNPSTARFETSPGFLDSLVSLSGEERSECIEGLIAQIGAQIALSGQNGVAEALDSTLEIEINEKCIIKRK